MSGQRQGPKSLEERCKNYLLEEPDEDYKAQVHALLMQKDKGVEELKSRMVANLGFGTAGLRAVMEAGYNRMNLVTVYRFCYAVGNEIVLKPGQKNRRVIIGYDARLNSEIFAKSAADILCSMGAVVYMFSEYISDPAMRLCR